MDELMPIGEEWERISDVDAAQRAARRLLDPTPVPMTGRKAMPTLTAAARSDVGHVRDTNEDAVLCLDHLIAVGDGMGGLPGGEVAAALAVSLLEAAFSGQSLEELEAGARAANRAIVERADESRELTGRGTTLCAAGSTADGRLALVNVGDSRAYLLREGSLEQLTEDHSVTADMVRRGELDPADARSHPHHNLLTRVLGGGPTVNGTLHTLVGGYRLLLCTDGLFNEVDADDIRTLLDTNADVGTAADALVERALGNGGRDNVTVVVADVFAD